MDVSPDIAIAALLMCMSISLAFPFAKAFTDGVFLWAVVYPCHLLRASRRGNSRHALLLSAVMSVGGALYSGCRSLWFRASLKIRRDSSELNRDKLVKLIQLSGPSKGDLIIVVPGTWSGQWNLPNSPLQVLLKKIEIDRKDSRIFLAPWFAVNDHNLRIRAATELAALAAAELHEGEMVSLVGHSHGGTLAAIAAALLPVEKVTAVVTLGTPFVTETDNSLTRRIVNLSAELTCWMVLADGYSSFVLEKLFHYHFQRMEFWIATEYRWRLITIFTICGLLSVGALLAFGKLAKKPPVRYFSGSRFTAIFAIEDRLLELMSSVTRMQQAWWAIQWRIEKSQMREDRANSSLRKYLFIVFQTLACLMPVFFAVEMLPAHRDKVFEAGFIIGFALFFSGLAAHLIPNPYVAMFGRFSVSMVAALVRLVPNLLLKIVFGVPITGLQTGDHVVDNGKSLGGNIVPVSVGKICDVHTNMLRCIEVTKMVSDRLQRVS